MIALSSRSAWLIAAGLSLGPAASNGIARFAYGLVLPAMRQDLSWTYTEAGWINTSNAIGYLLGSALSLRFIGSVGPRRLFIGGMVLTTLALLVSGLTRDYLLLNIMRVLAGVGGAPVFIAGGAMASTLFKGDKSRNALAIAVYFGGGGLGILLTGLSVPLMLDRLGVSAWPDAWLLMAGLCGLATIPAATAANAIPLTPRAMEAAMVPPLPLRRMSALMLGYFLFGVGYIVYLTFLVAWMRSGNAGTERVALTWAVLGVAVMISPLPWRGVLAGAKGGRALSLACLMTGAGILLPLIVRGAAGSVLSAAVFGVAMFIAPAAVTAFGRKNLPEGSWGASVALFTTVFAVGQGIGPVAAGLIADTTHTLTAGLVAAGVTLFGAAVIASQQRALVH